MNWTPPILIYQMGKVGSTAIQVSLNALHLPSIHTHFLSRQGLRDGEDHYSGLTHVRLPGHVSRSKKLRELMDKTWGRIRWKVITLVREPVARTVSDVFQNMPAIIPRIHSLNENEAIGNVSNYILEYFTTFNEENDYVCSWFDREIKDVFKLDVYAQDFRKTDGYQIYEAANADILLIKLENLSECHQTAFQDFLGIRNFELIKANVGNQKPYKRLYQTVLNRIAVPGHILDRLYATRFVRQFYATEEIYRFKTRWLNHRQLDCATVSNSAVLTDASTDGAPAGRKTATGFYHPNGPRRFSDCRYHPRISTRFTRGASRHNLPTISLVTPSYNQGKYLEECIDSVLSQNYPNLEYIVMDGGSTDDSVQIIKRYEKYLTFWQSRPDGGQYAAINDGLRRTRGEIMTWLNSDDKFQPDAFFMVAGLFTLRKDVEWITGRPNTLDDYGRQLWICEYPIVWQRTNYLKKQFKDPWIQQEGTFWRRRLWEKSGSSIRTDMDFAGDLELWARFFRYARLYTLDALLAGYRFQPESKSRLSMDKYLQEAHDVLDEELRLFKSGHCRQLLPSPEPLTVRDVREGVNLIRSQVPAIDSLLDKAGGPAAFKGGHRTAVEFYERSLASNPADARLHNSLGMLYWIEGDVKKSIAQFSSALRINPAYLDAVLNLADVLIRIKEEQKANRLYAAYMSHAPREKYSLGKLANIGSQTAGK